MPRDLKGCTKARPSRDGGPMETYDYGQRLPHERRRGYERAKGNGLSEGA